MKTPQKFAGASLLAVSALLIPNLCSAAWPDKPPEAGRVVLTYQNRLYLNALPPTEVLVAFYFTDILGVEGPLFNGAPSESTAYFTALYENPGAQIVVNGDVSTAVFTPGHILKIYFNANPNSSQTWDDPNSFAAGEHVATYESSIGTSASTPLTGPGITNVTQSYLLRWSKSFVYRGKTYNLKELIPNGFTSGPGTSGTANFAATAPGFAVVSAGAGSFVAIGGLFSGLPGF